MATANPLPAPPWTDGPIDDAYLAGLPADVREAIEAADARASAGTSRTVPHEDVLAHIERQRLAATKAG